jgi:predicted glutamine amidotransferase
LQFLERVKHMCIIAVKPAGIGLPDYEKIENMFFANPDGAGLMYTENGSVCIKKGFMTLSDLDDGLRHLEKQVNIKNTPIILHFRFSTGGGILPENTHPFPVVGDIYDLKKRQISCLLGMAHNGIIPGIKPRKGISDTMEYITSELAYIYQSNPCFYKEKDGKEFLLKRTNSKLAFLDKNGNIETVGHFIADGGVLYSNDSYKSYNYSTKDLMWLNSADHLIVDKDNKILDAADYYLIDGDGSVYEYDFYLKCALKIVDAFAITLDGKEATFVPSKTICKKIY